MPNGFIGFFFALSIVIGSYQGVELIGISAGETKILKKYCKGSQRSNMENFNFLYWCNFVIVSVYPWNQLGNIGSPFVATFAKVGITFAAGLINFVVLTAALSGCNSGIFSASRMIYTLAKRTNAKVFTKVMKNGVPSIHTVFAVSMGILISIVWL